MSDVSVQAFVSQAGLPDLDINDGVNFILGRRVEPGETTWRKETVESPFVHGHLVVGEVRSVSEMALGVYVIGDTDAEMQANLDTLLRAFEQREYDLRITVQGQAYAWRCERADYQVSFVTEYFLAKKMAVALSFNRHPIPVQGPV